MGSSPGVGGFLETLSHVDTYLVFSPRLDRFPKEPPPSTFLLWCNLPAGAVKKGVRRARIQPRLLNPWGFVSSKHYAWNHSPSPIPPGLCSLERNLQSFEEEGSHRAWCTIRSHLEWPRLLLCSHSHHPSPRGAWGYQFSQPFVFCSVESFSYCWSRWETSLSSPSSLRYLCLLFLF